MVDKEQNVLIANTEGLYTDDKRVRTRLFINAVACNGENQTGTEGPGRRWDLKCLIYIDPEYYGREAARSSSYYASC